MIHLNKENKIPFQIIENNGLNSLQIKIVDHIIDLPNNELIKGHTRKFSYKIIKITFPKDLSITERLNVIQEQIEKAEIITKNYYLVETSNEIIISDKDGNLKNYCKFFSVDGLLLFSIKEI